MIKTTVYSSSMSKNTPSLKLADIPLWRLLIHLDDAESRLGSSADSVRILTAEVQRRLQQERPKTARRQSEAIGDHR
ncbi:hypothetical protein J8F10_15640 [Gemmata sp. G18]|uniref:Uncharacterized protein n=1 Tax=Gemmata palustris TaxID=2822762 RepID=A0ABS5BSJ1_9BACT|nr:hypothetical protein [Gemmata palustris]MBP3956707.1 hypothetical protein [Gemmata palustris]